jgi:hypothetical protein
MSKRVKLVYDFYENKNAYYGFEITDEISKDYNKEILNLEDITYDKNRKLIIYSWGIIKHEEPKCEISFDVTKFTTKTDNKHIKLLDGRSDEILKKHYYENSVIKHLRFLNKN